MRSIGVVDLRRRLFAASYARSDAVMRRATDPARRLLVGDLNGEVLEIGVGTGANFEYYPKGAHVTATDPSQYMLRRAASSATDATARIELQLADAMALPFSDSRFDAVVATLVLCSVPDQSTALAEIRRVLKPGGSLRLLEHVRSDRPAVAALQRLASPAWSLVSDGCHLDRDTATEVRAAGFEVESYQASVLRLPMKHIVLLARRSE